MKNSSLSMVVRSVFFSIAAFFVVNGAAFSAEADLERWIRAQGERSLKSVYRAISPRDGAVGSIIASPSRGDPDYYAYWVRDGALVMREVWAYRSVNPAHTNKLMKDFALFSRANQETPNWSGPAYGRGLGEPKFEITGKPYDKGWGRPQNDGPALRAIVLLDFANELMRSGERDFVSRVLYRPEMPARTVIKADLEYTAHHWRESNFDLWEEINGDQFYTRIAQWRALDEGSRFAARVGDEAASRFYRQQAGLIQESLKGFWSSRAGYLLATKNRVGGIDDKHSNLDVAIVLGALHSGRSGSPFYVNDSRVIATAHALENKFKSIYSVNRLGKNREGGRMAPGIGRYPEDRYDGHRTDRQGNPWFLATHAMAEFHLILRSELKAAGRVEINDLTRPFYESLLGEALVRKRSITRAEPAFDTILRALKEKSDAFVRRSRFHTANNGSQAEQFNREHGFMQGARDLTWSYASFLSLLRVRDRHYE